MVRLVTLGKRFGLIFARLQSQWLAQPVKRRRHGPSTMRGRRRIVCRSDTRIEGRLWIAIKLEWRSEQYQTGCRLHMQPNGRQESPIKSTSEGNSTFPLGRDDEPAVDSV